MIRYLSAVAIGFIALAPQIAAGQSNVRRVDLPTSKAVTLPVPGFVARTNSFPAAIAISPDGRYAAVLNEGYGTPQSGLAQSIGVLDLKTNAYRDFADARLRGEEKTTLQSYFVGLAFSRDGKHLYASLASVTKNAVAVYSFLGGEI